jgi:hypothetical protein
MIGRLASAVAAITEILVKDPAATLKEDGPGMGSGCPIIDSLDARDLFQIDTSLGSHAVKYRKPISPNRTIEKVYRVCQR